MATANGRAPNVKGPNAGAGGIVNSAKSSIVSLSGTGVVSQIISGVVLVAVLYLTLAFSEYIYSSYVGMLNSRIELFPNTYSSSAKMYTAIQNPANPAAKTVNFSDGERSGVEFSYSLFVYVASDTFTSGEHKLHHILHKGYSKPYPLLGPGIFMWGDTNMMRVYMNSYDSWNNYTDIPNIPVDKWLHLTVSCKGNQLYVYINGNLKHKMALSNNTPPYQNFGDVFAFSSRTLTLNPTLTDSLKADPDFSGTSPPASIVFAGAMKGMISRVYYFNYALTYTEIQNLMNMGPSPVMDSASLSMTPYLADTWWTSSQTGA